jgi:hypothetical protein
MVQRVTIGQLRGIKLPPVKKDEADHIVSLRRTLEIHEGSPEKVKVCVPDEIADLILDEPKEVKSDAKLKS